jgi:hypothetical protein
MPWRFKNFVDDRGENAIYAALLAMAIKDHSRLNAFIRHLEAQSIFDARDVEWLEGECDGLIALCINIRGVQHRPLGYLGPGPRELTLLLRCTEKNNRYKPPSYCGIGQRRRALVESDPMRYTCDHDFT